MVTTAIAVIEDGHATYAVGELTAAQLYTHQSKIDLAIGTYNREYEQLRTETILERLEQSGVSIPQETKRYYLETLRLTMPTKAESVEKTLIEYLKKTGFTVAKAPQRLHIRHLERMRHRTGFIMGKEDTNEFTYSAFR